MTNFISQTTLSTRAGILNIDNIFLYKPPDLISEISKDDRNGEIL